MHERYPELPCFIAVDLDEEKPRFEELGLGPVVDCSIPRGLDLAMAVLQYQGVDQGKTAAWMRLRQERALPSALDRPGEIDFNRPHTSHA